MYIYQVRLAFHGRYANHRAGWMTIPTMGTNGDDTLSKGNRTGLPHGWTSTCAPTENKMKRRVQKKTNQVAQPTKIL